MTKMRKQKQKDRQKRKQKEKKMPHSFSFKLDFDFNPFGIIEDDNFLGDNFFKKDSVDIKYMDLYMIKSLFETTFKIIAASMNSSVPHPFGGGVLADIYNEYKILPDAFTKALEIASKASNVSDDPEVKIGEVARHGYKSDENFSLIIPISISLAVPFLSTVASFSESDLLAYAPVSEIRAKLKFDPKTKSQAPDPKSLDELEAALKNASSPFYEKMLSFCDLEIADKKFKESQFSKIVTDEPTLFEIRII